MILNANTEVFKNIKKFFRLVREQISKGILNTSKLHGIKIQSTSFFNITLITLIMLFLTEVHNYFPLLIFNCCYIIQVFFWIVLRKPFIQLLKENTSLLCQNSVLFEHLKEVKKTDVSEPYLGYES